MTHLQKLTSERAVRRVNHSGRITTKFIKERLLTPTISNTGYYVVNFSKENTCKTNLLHRVFAQHFLNNPQKLPHINHKDGNKLNNAIENLEWCTPQYNNFHSRNILKNNCAPKNPSRGKDHYYSKKIILTHPSGFKENFDCIMDAANKYNLSDGNLGSVLSDNRKHTKGFTIHYNKHFLLDADKPDAIKFFEEINK